MRITTNIQNPYQLVIIAAIAVLFNLSAPAQQTDILHNNNATMMRLEKFITETEDSLKYTVPDDEENGVLVDNKTNQEKNDLVSDTKSTAPVKAEFYTSSQDAWLIDAGYYKSNKIPAWKKVKQLFREKDRNKDLASEE